MYVIKLFYIKYLYKFRAVLDSTKYDIKTIFTICWCLLSHSYK